MFLTNKRSGYTQRGEQFASGKFLIFMQEETNHNAPNLSAEITRTCKAPIRCLVRHTHFTQCGQFMMGFARVHGKRITLSGAYGGDGLPRSVDVETYKRGVELPEELRELWNKGGGWNGAGNEAGAIRQWALTNLAELSK